MATNRPKIFLDADVIFAGSAAPSTQGASYVILLMGEITLLDCFTSAQVMTEVERNLTNKLPNALAEFHLLAKRCLTVVSDPKVIDLHNFDGQADPKDLPILVAAIQANCSHLITFNTRHFTPTGDQIIIQRPGEFLQHVRGQLRLLSNAEEWSDSL
ncbi:MAG: PIN domain-containing protein [Anaerolineae bacterium]|nr:PIN domain-containing protein [Anaerolineae bacterium]